MQERAKTIAKSNAERQREFRDRRARRDQELQQLVATVDAIHHTLKDLSPRQLQVPADFLGSTAIETLNNLSLHFILEAQRTRDAATSIAPGTKNAARSRKQDRAAS